MLQQSSSIQVTAVQGPVKGHAAFGVLQQGQTKIVGTLAAGSLQCLVCIPTTTSYQHASC
jgi:hypothetical protein